MSCAQQTAHSGHWVSASVWNASKGKYEQKQVWCPGR